MASTGINNSKKKSAGQRSPEVAVAVVPVPLVEGTGSRKRKKEEEAGTSTATEIPSIGKKGDAATASTTSDRDHQQTDKDCISGVHIEALVEISNFLTTEEVLNLSHTNKKIFQKICIDWGGWICQSKTCGQKRSCIDAITGDDIYDGDYYDGSYDYDDSEDEEESTKKSSSVDILNDVNDNDNSDDDKKSTITKAALDATSGEDDKRVVDKKKEQQKPSKKKKPPRIFHSLSGERGQMQRDYLLKFISSKKLREIQQKSNNGQVPMIFPAARRLGGCHHCNIRTCPDCTEIKIEEVDPLLIEGQAPKCFPCYNPGLFAEFCVNEYAQNSPVISDKGEFHCHNCTTYCGLCRNFYCKDCTRSQGIQCLVKDCTNRMEEHEGWGPCGYHGKYWNSCSICRQRRFCDDCVEACNCPTYDFLGDEPTMCTDCAQNHMCRPYNYNEEGNSWN